MRRLGVGFVLVLLAAALWLPAPASAHDGDAPPQLHRKGRWLVDEQGRTVIVHGFNMVYKLAPYSPPDDPAGFTEADAQWLADHGFNAARVGTLWAGLTPESADQLDPTYVAGVQRVLDLLAQRHIWMQLDMHQDQWNEYYGGEGVPDWAVIRPAPYDEEPYEFVPFPKGYWTDEVSTVFDNFWADHDGLLTDWAEAWQLTAQQWKDQPYLMGYDLLNEPWMGMEWRSCFTGCPASYPAELQPAMERGLAAVRSADPDNIVWWEPQQFAGGSTADTYFTPAAGERQLGFSWHNYCPSLFVAGQGGGPPDVTPCKDFSDTHQKGAIDQSRRMHAVPMMSEWGATDNLKVIAIDAAAADKHLMGWTHWAYKEWDDPTTSGGNVQGMFDDDADLSTLRMGKAKLLVRTYARATAGTPLSMHFNARNGEFHYRYRPDRAIHAPTEIFVSPLHYPDGYRVRVDGGTAVRAGDHLVDVRRSGKGVVSVTITRRS
ncbi:cellulase family glycosylhydrolase [Nocardioides sp. CN2-186]|uniref:cellulase family glycosylhydrolase n=1 Tax=Nocardioides tweenelious TaxID=3156607 RepID=UPI0032B5AA74